MKLVVSRHAVAVGWVALLLTSGCLRFGYKSHPRESSADAGRDDASVHTDVDAAQGGGGSGIGGSGASGSGMKDAATEAGAGKGGMDAQTSQDAGSMSMTEAGMDAAVSDADAATPMMDAGVTDAAISDAGTDAWVGSGLLCPPDALFCDGYENSDFSKKWEYSVFKPTNVSTAVQSTTTVHSGVGALKANTYAAHPGTSTTNAARWGTSLIFNQQKSGDVWVRWYYYLPSSTSVTTFFSTGVIAEAVSPFFGFSMIIRPTRVDIAQGDSFYPGSGAFPRDRWVCVELHAVVAAAPLGVFELYFDGGLVLQQAGVNSLPNTGYSSFDLGVHYTDPSQGPVEVYADDVAAGTTRIGCVP